METLFRHIVLMPVKKILKNALKYLLLPIAERMD